MNKDLLKALIDNMKEPQIAINCQLESEANELIQAFHELGFLWNVDHPLVRLNGEPETKWKKEKANTTYTFFPNSNMLLTSRKAFYEKKKIKIIEYKDIENYVSENSNYFDDSTSNKQNIISNDVDEQLNKSGPVEDNIICPNCGKTIKKDSKFCFYCGAPNKQNIVKEKSVPHNNEGIGEIINTITKETEIKVIPDENKTENNKTDVDTSLNNNNDTCDDSVIVKKKDETKNVAIKSSNTEIKNNENNIPYLCNILKVKPNQEFTITGNDFNYFNNTKIFRIDENGIRQEKVGHNLWFISNNEQELSYIINNPSCIQVIQ